MDRETENALYDKHNPGCRFSPDRNTRMYGQCGCRACARYRGKYLATVVSAIDQRNATMSSINICDRCPGMVKGRALGVVQLKTSSDPDSMEVVTRELCPACIEDLYVVLTADVEEREQRAYTEPFVDKKEDTEIDGATAEQLAAALFEKLMKTNNQKSIGSSDK